MELSIIIVNWHSKEHVRNCIASILATTRSIRFEIVVIDNASFDGCDEMLRQHYPQVRFIQSNQNLGFAKANNVAFLESQGHSVLFLNPDTEATANAINVMFEYLQQMPNAGAVNCRLLNADQTVQTSCIQSFPTILNSLLDSDLLRTLFPKLPLWGMAPLFSDKDGPVEVEALSGACIMLKRAIFESVGMFGEDYFMYAEDIDLCYKIRQAGYKNYFIPNVAVIHYGGASTEKTDSDFSSVTIRESCWRFLQKTRGKAYSMAYRLSMLLSSIGRITILLIILPVRIVRPNGVSGLSALHKWWAILSWSLYLKDSSQFSLK